MKLKLGLSCCLLDVYTKCQIDISKHVEKSPENFPLVGSPAEFSIPSVFGHQRASKHVEKSPENFERSKTRKNDRHNFEYTFFANNGPDVEKHTDGYLCTKFERSILIYEAMIAKIEIDLCLAVK